MVEWFIKVKSIPGSKTISAKEINHVYLMIKVLTLLEEEMVDYLTDNFRKKFLIMDYF